MHASISELLAVRDGELGIASLHVEECTICQHELQKLNTIGESLQDLPMYEPPSDSWQKLKKAQQKHQGSKQSRLQGLTRAIYTLAASILVVGFSFLVLLPESPVEENLSLLIVESRALESALVSIKSQPIQLSRSQQFKLEQLRWQIKVIDRDLIQASLNQSDWARSDLALSPIALEDAWRQRIEIMNAMLATYNNDPKTLKYAVERNLL